MKTVFIHGAYARNHCWNYLSTQLNVDKKDQIFLSYDIDKPFEHIIRSLKEQLHVNCPKEPIIIVGHSYGGALAVYLAEIEKIENIKKIVTLSSPLGGVEIARNVFIPFLSCLMATNNFWRNVSPTNSMFRSLRMIKNHEVPTTIIVVKTENKIVFLEPSDGTVSVRSQQSLGNRNNLQYYFVEGYHMSGLFDDNIIALIKKSCDNTPTAVNTIPKKILELVKSSL